MAAKRNHLRFPGTSSSGRYKGAEEVVRRRMKQLADQHGGSKSPNRKLVSKARATLRKMRLEAAERRAELVQMKEELAETEAAAEAMAKEVAGMEKHKQQALASAAAVVAATALLIHDIA